MTVLVEEAGLLTTIQDAGRYGYRGVGVALSGAVDRFALRAANLLVGNAPGAAALELTLTGPALRFERDTLVALCGADMDARADGEPLPGWRPALVRGGALLRLGPARAGMRAYLAAAGGFAVPEALGSRSTHVRAGLGGVAGRPLQAGDRLQLGPAAPHAAAFAARLAAAAPQGALAPARWALAPSARPAYAAHPVVRAVRGREAEAFEARSLERFFAAPYRITPQSDRMGCRLDGERLALTEPLEMVSEAVAPGTVQVPPDGRPIVLLADAQTTGGYPRIAQVTAADLPLFVQARPGAEVAFREISLAEAQALALLQELELRRLGAAAAARLKESEGRLPGFF